ncbi:hypothetical protein [Terasakiella sp. SH-1]|uniref:hypothetical protein n=1 Tax=Terasakiella sp. SH-1 TaxID=2560057 RepID=UPI0010730035|nr:hypothetical protein [Terasakiella sp. SH-1]
MLKRLASLCLLLILVACTQAPQPLRHSRTGFDTNSLRLRDGGTVLILPIEGTARPLGQTIAQGLAESLGVRNIPSTSKIITNPPYKVRGQVVIERNRHTPIIKGMVYWTFFSRDDKIVQESSQPIHVERHRWEYGDQHMIDQMVERAADQFAGYLQDRAERKAVELDERNKPVAFRIGQITGVNATNKRELTKAMALTLRQAGASVKSQPSPTTYQLSCEIDVLAPFEGKQRIKVAWIVKDPQGHELGRARQNNRLEQGRMEQPLGRMAYHIAKAALNGIGPLVERHRSEIQFERSREQIGYTAPPGRRNRTIAPPF